MKIGILKADSVLPQLQPEFGDYPEMFANVLQNAAESELEFVIYNVEQGVYPSDLDECDGYFITGSRYSVYDQDQWVLDLKSFVLRLHRAKKKLVGICFGHQMVALALGGNTEPAPVGWGVGVHQVEIIEQEDFMQPPLDVLNAIVSHKDQVSVLPEGARILAKSDFCPYAMMRIEDHILTFQGHLEFCKDYSRALMTFRRELLGELVFSQGINSLDASIESDVMAKWSLNFIAS